MSLVIDLWSLIAKRARVLNYTVKAGVLRVLPRSLRSFLNRERELKPREATTKMDQECGENQTNSVAEFLYSPEGF